MMHTQSEQRLALNSIYPKIAGAKAWPGGHVWKQIISFSFSKLGNSGMNLPRTTVHKQTRSEGPKQKNTILLIISSMNDLAQTEVFSHHSFVYAFSQSAPQHEGSFVVGLCVGKECDKDFKGWTKALCHLEGAL